MEITEQPKLQFLGVDILNIDFVSHAPARRVASDKEIKIGCVPKVLFPKENKMIFHVVMDLTLSSDKLFDLSLQAVGTFALNQDVTEDLKRVFVNTNAPAIMFPYLRSFVTTLTSNMGQSVEPLIMPTQFFSGVLEELDD